MEIMVHSTEIQKIQKHTHSSHKAVPLLETKFTGIYSIAKSH